MKLESFDTNGFLLEYWQKQPLLIRNPWKRWSNPLAPDELAGLACEEGVESRLIIQAHGKFKVEDGPIAEARFEELGKDPWALLVQSADHHVPAVAALLESFRFVPNWRIDDVMVSYATDQGGVGPHFDHYDVFLLQGLGKRLWRLGPMCDSATPLVPHDDLRLLANFEAVSEWILEAGDILYVPPGVAHEGVAIGDDCMTYSIGFRAPSRGELIEHFSEQLLVEMQEDDRYRDPDLQAQENPGEIGPAAIARLHDMITEKMLDRDAFARWFGQYSSTPKFSDVDWRPEEPVGIAKLREGIGCGASLSRNPASRFSFIRQPDGSVMLFVDGQRFHCTSETTAFALQICAYDLVTVNPELKNSDRAMALIATLFNQGSLAFEPEG